MVIVQFKGGLGNQMYQYALLAALRSRGRTVLADTSFFRRERRADDPLMAVQYALDCFENVRLQEATPRQIAAFPASDDLLFKLRRRFSLPGGTRYEETDSATADLRILERDKLYLDGYWQNHAYFETIREQLLHDFTFRPSQNPRNTALLARIAADNAAVSVHIRRGDYLKLQALYGGICTRDYYDRAFSLAEQKTPNAHYYFFSDDPAWVRGNFALPGMTVVDWNTSLAESCYDLQLMSLCRNNIICNSTFSWWAAWLNRNPDKQVIAPGGFQAGKPFSAQQRVAGWIYL